MTKRPPQDETPSEKQGCPLPLSEAEIKRRLSSDEYRVMRQNGTEAPFQNAYWNEHRPGLYVDRLSGKPLFSSQDKFDSRTGWPSFTRPIEEKALEEKSDKSHGMERIEVRSASSDSHLGHLFPDGPKPTGLRYCINSAALRFIPLEELEKEGYGEYRKLFGVPATRSAYFAGGCFWGVESLFRELAGVVQVTSGYMGGSLAHPTYEAVCTGRTGHAETVRVDYDPAKVSYEKLLEYFFEIHDPTTLDRQGPDVGEQYRSAIFASTDEELKQAQEAKERLNASGSFPDPVVTDIERAGEFWPAEDYHQRYFEKRGIKPICHFRKK